MRVCDMGGMGHMYEGRRRWIWMGDGRHGVGLETGGAIAFTNYDYHNIYPKELE